MRLLHTADWHLGRIFHGVHLTDDQAHVLDQVVGLVRDTRPDAVLISGDVYDRAVPPPEAVSLLDDVLSRIVIGFKIPVVMIAGNHDSPERLGFASRLLANQGLHVFGSLSADVSVVPIPGKDGVLRVYGLPYAEPSVVRQRLQNDAAQDHAGAMRVLTDRVREAHPSGQPCVVMAHAFVAGGEESESERPLSVGGAGSVEAAVFEGFDYVALGHLHRPQRAGLDHVQYSGSILKYSFSEDRHTKSVSLVELGAGGHMRVERVPLTPRRDVRRVEGYLAGILDEPLVPGRSEDYLMVTLLDEGPILDAMGKLRQAYPNVLHIERPCLTVAGDMRGPSADHRKMTEVDLFSSFFSQVTGESLTEEESAAFASLVETLHQQERGA